MTPEIKISIVLTTYNRRASLERCLISLANQRFPAGEYEIVVIADGCIDGTVELLRSFKCPCSFRWFEQPNRGQPAAQNYGVSAASGEYVLFIDDDFVCDEGLVAAHYEAHRSSDKRVVVGAITLHPDSPPGTIRDLIKDLDEADIERLRREGVRPSDLMLCANSSITRQAALDCPFDISYKRIHDVEAGVRLWSKGFRPYFAANAIGYEVYIKSEEGILMDSWQQGRHEVILAKAHPSFKPLAGLARLNTGNPLKRALRKRLALHARASEAVLAPLYRIMNALRAFPVCSRMARRILMARAGTAHLSGALQQAGSWRWLEEQFAIRVPAIMYHNVGEPRAGEYPGLTTPTEEFKRQIRFLAKLGYKGISPSAWLRWRDEGGTLPKNPIMLVFDDAYLEASEKGFPILETHGFSAACMVVTRYVGSTNGWDEDAGRPSFQLMNADEIRGWAKRGIEFGGHSYSHPSLPNLRSDEVELEIAKCRDDLAALLGEMPASFAYPFGDVSADAVKSARSNFRLAFTAAPGRLHLATNPHLAPRIAFLPGESRFGMWCRLRLGKNPYEVCRGRWEKVKQLIARYKRAREPLRSQTTEEGERSISYEK